MGAVSMAIIGDRVPAERRGRAIGTVMTAYAVSAVAGVPLGLGLAQLLGWRAPFWAVGGLASGVWLCLLRMLPTADDHLKAPRGENRLASPWAVGSQGLALGWLLTFAVVFSGFLLIPYLSPFMVGNLGVSPAELPWIYLCGGAATLLSSRLIGQWVDRRGPSLVLAGLLVGTVVPYLVFTHLTRSPLPVVILVFVLFMTLTSGRQIPTLALLAGRVPPSLRGRYLAINMAASDGASGLAAWVSGPVARDGLGWRADRLRAGGLGRGGGVIPCALHARGRSGGVPPRCAPPRLQLPSGSLSSLSQQGTFMDTPTRKHPSLPLPIQGEMRLERSEPAARGGEAAGAWSHPVDDEAAGAFCSRGLPGLRRPGAGRAGGGRGRPAVHRLHLRAGRQHARPPAIPRSWRPSAPIWTRAFCTPCRLRSRSPPCRR